MDPLYTIATARRREMELAGATERLASEIRRARPRRSPAAAVAALVARIRDTRPAVASQPCPTC